MGELGFRDKHPTKLGLQSAHMDSSWPLRGFAVWSQHSNPPVQVSKSFPVQWGQSQHC